MESYDIDMEVSENGTRGEPEKLDDEKDIINTGTCIILDDDDDAECGDNESNDQAEKRGDCQVDTPLDQTDDINDEGGYNDDKHKWIINKCSMGVEDVYKNYNDNLQGVINIDESDSVARHYKEDELIHEVQNTDADRTYGDNETCIHGFS